MGSVQKGEYGPEGKAWSLTIRTAMIETAFTYEYFRHRSRSTKMYSDPPGSQPDQEGAQQAFFQPIAQRTGKSVL